MAALLPDGRRHFHMFLTDPIDLDRRHRYCKPVVQDVENLTREIVPCCNVCFSERNIILSTQDRYGLPLRTAMCLNCGLIYLVDRLTPASYREFYQRGTYRDISSRFNNTHHSIADIEASQSLYAKNLIRAIDGYVDKTGNLIDIGGSVGRVCREIADHFQMRGTILDPAEDEIAGARKFGLKTVSSAIEEWDTDERFDLVLLCRSIEHLVDLRKALGNIRRLLSARGLLYCDIADFMDSCEIIGPPRAVTKLDHCYWLCLDTAYEIFRALGFDIVSMNITSGQAQVGFLLRRSELRPVSPLKPEWIQRQARKLQHLESQWIESGRSPRNLTDRLRLRAYRVKRFFSRSLSKRPVASAPQPLYSSTPAHATSYEPRAHRV